VLVENFPGREVSLSVSKLQMTFIQMYHKAQVVLLNSLEKGDGYFNLAKVISVAAELHHVTPHMH